MPSAKNAAVQRSCLDGDKRLPRPEPVDSNYSIQAYPMAGDVQGNSVKKGVELRVFKAILTEFE